MLLECNGDGVIGRFEVERHWYCQGCGEPFDYFEGFISLVDRLSRISYVAHATRECERLIFEEGPHGPDLLPAA